LVQRDGEPVFRPRQDLLWQQRGGHALEEKLLPQPRELETARDREGVLDDRMVEEGNADFESHRHAGFVDFLQIGIRQPGAQIHEQQVVETGASAHPGDVEPGRIETGVTLAQRAREERLAHVARERRQPVRVPPAMIRQVEGRQRLLETAQPRTGLDDAPDAGSGRRDGVHPAAVLREQLHDVPLVAAVELVAAVP
jgi:hypothetical protein